MNRKLAILTSHPIQYNSPLFSELSNRGIIDIRVFYSWGEQSLGEKFDHGFGIMVGWDIPLLSGYPYEFLENSSREPGVHHFRGIQNPGLVQAINSYNPDAILIYGWSFTSHLKALIRFKNKIPVYFRGDSTCLDSGNDWKQWLRTTFLRWVYAHVDTAFYVGKNNYTYYIRAGMKPAQLVLAPHAIDNQRFMQPDDEYEARSAEFRRSLNISKTDFVFLFAGKFEPKKDPLLLLNTFLGMQNRKDIHLVMIGNGPLQNMMETLAGNDPAIHFLPFQNQQMMPVVYRAADVFILPSQGPNETWGLAINEAMACSRPVIASDKCGGAIDLIDEGINGYIFKSGNQQDLTLKMNLMLEQKQQLDSMRLASLEKIRHFSYTNICQAIEHHMIKGIKTPAR